MDFVVIEKIFHYFVTSLCFHKYTQVQLLDTNDHNIIMIKEHIDIFHVLLKIRQTK